MKILSIGNSFSQDAQKYLYELAKKDGTQITVANLYVGGCPLRTHYINALNDYEKYNYQFNGFTTDLLTSIRRALESLSWDYVTFQQASKFSFVEDSYYPYVNYLYDYVKKYCPKAKILIHQTWPYQNGSTHLLNHGYFCEKDMFNDVCKAYSNVCKNINADGIIPCGQVMFNLSQKGIEMYSDGMHASLGAGRYALALTWYKMLTGKSVLNNDFVPFEGQLTEEERKIIIEEVEKIEPTL